MCRIFHLSLAILFVAATSHADEEPPFYTPKRDQLPKNFKPEPLDPTLPNVLLIGDSIMGGYYKPTKSKLKGVANVVRHPGNGGDTTSGLKKLDGWLGNVKWDVIHFNWGLHDLCYRHPEAQVYGKRDKVCGTISVPLEDYGRNLDSLVTRLKKTEAKLIFATITKVPEGEAGRKLGDDSKYNEVALSVMKKHDVPVNDLAKLTASFASDMFSKPADVHFSSEGAALLAAQVAEAIKSRLE